MQKSNKSRNLISIVNWFVKISIFLCVCVTKDSRNLSNDKVLRSLEGTATTAHTTTHDTEAAVTATTKKTETTNNNSESANHSLTIEETPYAFNKLGLGTEYSNAMAYNFQLFRNSSIEVSDNDSYLYRLNFIEKNEAWSEVCRTGSLQSPIDIPFKYNKETSKSMVTIESIFMTDSNGDSLIKDVTYSPGGVIDLSKLTKKPSMIIKTSTFGLFYNYILQKIYMKYPAEHQMNGVQYDMELQFEFTKDMEWVNNQRSKGLYSSTGVDPDSQFKYIMVSSVFSKTGNANDNLRGLRVSTYGPILNEFNMASFIPKNQPFFYYDGSLTSPTCEESVKWIINRNIFETDSKQLLYYIAWINTKYPLRGNGRPVKSNNNGRVVYFQYNPIIPTRAVSKSSFISNSIICFFIILLII